MNSTFGERVQGFLKRRSTSHSVEWEPKSGVTPASSSSQFSIGVTSTAAVGPKLDPPSLTFQLAAPPSSTIAAGSFSLDCAKAFPKETLVLKRWVLPQWRKHDLRAIKTVAVEQWLKTLTT